MFLGENVPAGGQLQPGLATRPRACVQTDLLPLVQSCRRVILPSSSSVQNWGGCPCSLPAHLSNTTSPASPGQAGCARSRNRMLQAHWCCRADSAVPHSAAHRAGEQVRAAATF